MKALVVYYSLEGNTRFIAESIAEAVGADLLELKPTEDIPSKGFMKFVRGARQVITRKQPELQPLDSNPQDYGILFIGSPVWAGTYTPALRSFFASAPIKGKKVAVFCCHGGGKGRTLGKMGQALEGNELVGEMDFLEPLRKGRDEKGKKAADWAGRIVSAAEGQPAGE
jgi:flavodoxin